MRLENASSGLYLFCNDSEDIIDQILFPKKTVFTVGKDFNILFVHKTINNFFAFLHKKIPELEKLKNKNQLLLKESHTRVQKHQLKKLIARIDREIQNIKQRKQWQEYAIESKPHLEKFISINPKNKIVKFGKISGEEVDPVTEQIRKNCINDYLEIARKYIPTIEIHRNEEYEPTCPACGVKYEEGAVENDGFLECKCGYMETIFSKESMFKDTSRCESTRGDGDYQNRQNYEKTIDKLAGKRDEELPNKFYSDIDKYLQSYRFPKGERIRQMPLNDDGTRGKWMDEDGKILTTSRGLLTRALKETGYSDYYEDERYISNKYWGWRLPDIPPHIKEKYMELHDIQQPAYAQTKKKRKSALNTQYQAFRNTQLIEKLYGHYIFHNRKCNIDDFRVVKTEEIINEHDKIWTNMCQLTNLPLILKTGLEKD